jgi:FlaA1/EpsC-like NDP-sugar epimerase
LKRILITGITGTLGTALTRFLLRDPETEIIGVSRDEQKQRQMPTHERLRLAIADVRDGHAVSRAIGNKDLHGIFHLAALKCVDTLEFNPEEAIKTNVGGTSNMLDIADQYGAKLVLTSTDKACYPVNAYGASKYLAERIVLQAGHTAVRYGNVIGSRGSFVPNLILSLKTEGKAYLTHPEMTRFWMSVDQVVQFVVKAMMNPDKPKKTITPPGIQASSLKEFIKAVAAFCAVENYEIEEIGIRPGEKLHEVLVTREEGGLITSADKDLQFDNQTLIRFIDEALRGEG